jgi:ribonuclease HI
LTARFRVVRQDLNALDKVMLEDFRRALDLTVPFFIETDGACSGNPGPGGWGFIISQGTAKIEAYGAEGSTTNDEMELRAIDEALKFFGNVGGYAVIESDSQGCLDVMLGRGDKWEADNWTRLDGSPAKNRELVSSITARIKSFNVEYRKVKGHNNDQWNDAVDALGVRGRVEAEERPKVSLDLVTQERSISFRQRALRPETPSPSLYMILRAETPEKIPSFSDTKLFKDGAEYSGLWTSGHHQFRHKALPPPIAPIRAPVAPAALAPKAKPVSCGVWDGRKLVPTRKFVITEVSKEERLRIFNEAFAIGDEVRYCVNDHEVAEAELKPSQPYSIYPRTFERSVDTVVSVKNKTNPIRTEGPMIRIQWILLSETGVSLMMPTSATVPEEISLGQLWHRHIANRYKKPVAKIKWGTHYCAGAEIESGKVTEFKDNDSVEVVIASETESNGQLEVVYTLGEDKQVYRLYVRDTATMGEIRTRISQMHKGKPIQALSYEGSDFSERVSGPTVRSLEALFQSTNLYLSPRFCAHISLGTRTTRGRGRFCRRNSV